MRRLIVHAAFVLVLVYTWVAGRPDDSPPQPGSSEAAMSFRESAVARGLEFVHRPTRVDRLVENVAPHVEAVGASVSCVDADGDGWIDLFATTSADGAPNALFRNLGGGEFEDVAERAGVAFANREGVSASMGSIWADVDNDGDADGYRIAWGIPSLYLNRGDLSFDDATESSGLATWMNSNCAVWLDYDLDGTLDLYVGGYRSAELDLWNLESTRIMHESFEFARNGGHNRLWRGLGAGRFEDVTASTGADSTRWTFALASADFDRDGWPDLYLANDYGPEELLLNRDGERFEAATGIGLEEDSKSGMCVAVGDVLNEARPSVFVTNISEPGYLFQGNNLRVSLLDSGGTMMPIQGAEVENCGWAWGSQFGDLDNDGFQDLIVVNGFLSGNPDREDYWYQMSKVGLSVGSLVEDAANWAPIEDRSLSGYQRTRVLRNLGRGRFDEVGRAVGIEDTHDGRGVAVGDLDGDGRLDVVIANQSGPLLYYENATDAGHHWIGFDLVGTRSNRDAIGAELELEWEGGRQLQVVAAPTGFAAQNPRRLHFGLGSSPGPVRASIRWPSGARTTLESLPLDQVHRVLEEAE